MLGTGVGQGYVIELPANKREAWISTDFVFFV